MNKYNGKSFGDAMPSFDYVYSGQKEREDQPIEEKWKIELNNLIESFDDWSEDADGDEHYCPSIDWKKVESFIENLLEQERKNNKFDISITHPLNHNSK